MTMKVRCLLVTAAVTAGMSMIGCEQEREKTPLHAQVTVETAIELPEKPDFMTAIEKMAPAKDGVYTPESLVFHQKELLDKTVRVRGRIVDVSEDCPSVTVPRKKRGKDQAQDDIRDRKCRHFSVLISSDEGSSRRVLLTGYHPYYHPHLTVGMSIDATGKYVLFGSNMVSSRDGMILVDKLHDMGVDTSGNFSTNPREISGMIARGELAGMK